MIGEYILVLYGSALKSLVLGSKVAGSCQTLLGSRCLLEHSKTSGLDNACLRSRCRTESVLARTSSQDRGMGVQSSESKIVQIASG